MSKLPSATARRNDNDHGQFHRSSPGNVVLLNPEEVHDGHPGNDSTLGYVMVYVSPRQVESMFADAGGAKTPGDLGAGKR
ncbi:AraC family ligand binding domain-containing protein [Halomonas kenyensis]|uniref:AraC family ligand binding domain-containing protein n=1 Tax=Billgrantia kenyensis TaxID=321266 RepID=A0A7W0AEG6_9GAMM|nr:AraC family ligand binding domain-containing protein [Halomonas kenyensis]MCG6663221.1 hypothetical protein [Halomonas kenyensis]